MSENVSLEAEVRAALAECCDGVFPPWFNNQLVPVVVRLIEVQRAPLIEQVAEMRVVADFSSVTEARAFALSCKSESDRLRAARDALYGEVEDQRLRAERAEAAIRIAEPDNHHNAAACTYCGDLIAAALLGMTEARDVFAARVVEAESKLDAEIEIGISNALDVVKEMERANRAEAAIERVRAWAEKAWPPETHKHGDYPAELFAALGSLT